MSKAELEASIATVEFWIQLFAVICAIGLVGEVGLGVRHWILDRRLKIIQDAEDVEQQTNMASLAKDTVDANLARIKIEEKLAPRKLSREQQESIAGKLRSFPAKAYLAAYADDLEAFGLADEIMTALGPKGAHWQIQKFSALPTESGLVSGIVVRTTSDAPENARTAARELISALSQEGLEVSDTPPDNPMAIFDKMRVSGTFLGEIPIRISVGRKP